VVRVLAVEDLNAVAAKIAITGAAGLVGQNLIPRLKARGYGDIVAIDKHPANTALLRRLHPDIAVVEADLAGDGAWERALAESDVVVICHAQIGGLDRAAYARNNITATERLLAAVAPKRDVIWFTSVRRS
jgi:nucleoside-diphosphate-sugar epimerase